MTIEQIKEIEERIEFENSIRLEKGKFKYLTPKETLDFIANHPLRRVPERNRCEFLVDGKGILLGRTDLSDDIRTYSVTVDACLRFNDKNIYIAFYGARLTEDELFIIDSLTDG